MATKLPVSGSGGNILGSAFLQFGWGTGSKPNVPAASISNPTAQYEYGQAGRTGRDTDGDGYREVDCSALVYNALRNAGYPMPGVVPTSGSVNFTTSTLFHGKDLTGVATKNFDEIKSATDYKPGDIMLFAPRGGAQHMGIYYGQDAAGNPMFYGSQSSTGPGVFTMKDADPTRGIGITYFNTDNLVGVLRPKPELYVPEMDLHGGPGTGLSSSHVIATVNLLKNNAVEGYRPHIYSDNEQGKGDGVPTVGNGFALVVKGSNGWTVRPENEIKDLLRDAGLPESKYGDLPMDKLRQSASLLNNGDKAGARAVFGTGAVDNGFALSSAEADQLTASFVVREVIPRTLSAVGGAQNFADFSDGEFAAVASRTYQNPGWLKSSDGQRFLKAWAEGDDATAQAALGNSLRGQAEASAYAGNISIINDHLNAGTVASKPAKEAPNGHWEDTGIPLTDAEGNQTGVNVQTWVEDPAASAALGSDSSTNTATISSSSTATERTSPPASPATTQISPDGTTATLPNGQIIHAGTGSSLSIDIDGSLIVDRPAAGWANEDGSPADIRQVTTYDAKGHQVGTVVAQNLPGQSALIENGEERSIVIPNADGTTSMVQAHFLAGTGWIDNQDGQTVLSLKDWQARTDAHNAHLQAAPSADNDYQPGSSNGEAEAAAYLASHNSGTPANDKPANDTSAIYGQLEDAFTIPDTSPVREGVQYADAGNVDVLSDAGGGGDSFAESDSVPNQPLALAESAPAAPETVASASQAELAQQAALEEAQFNAAANNAAGALSLINSLVNLQHFDKLTELGKLQSLVGLYNQIDNLGQAGAVLSGTTSQLSGDTGGNLPGDLGQWGAGLSLVTALQGNDPIAQASAAGAFYNSIGSASNNIPLPYLQALNLIGAIESGNTVSMVASAVAFIPGWGTAASIAISIIAPLLADKPPPPEGATHYEWDAQGNIQIKLDYNQSRGGEMAQSTAQSVQGLLNSIVQSINEQTPETSDNVAINPYLLPRVGYSQAGGAWIEMTTPDGGSYREVIQGNNLAQRLFEVLTENGGIAPAWQVQTQMGHMQQLLAEGAGQGEIAAQLGAGAGGHAYHGNQAYALEGNATESADFKTQSFGSLVVHLNTDAVQASTKGLQSLQDQQAEHAVQTSTLYRDTEGDGYFEKTQWVSATDANGNLQGMLVIDYNGNDQIETRDILNLGGNAGHATEGAAQPGNNAADALAATANAHLQRNNVEWLDANGDGVLDKSDPAFAAIRLWVDVNQDARLDNGEKADLASLQITSINFSTGAVTYADGHSDALSATTLQSDTEGMRYTQMQEADAQGNLHTINAGQMLEHEGYQGQVQVTDQAGVTRWGSVREATFEHNALRTGDWEGTAEQNQHRHGGTNVASAPKQTRASGALGLEEVKRVVYVPATATPGNERTDSPTAQMLRSAQEGALLGGGLGAGMGALALVGLGAVQTTAFAAPGQEGMHGDYAPDDERVRTTDKGVPASDARHAVLPFGPSLPLASETVLGTGPGGTWQAAPLIAVDAPPLPRAAADADASQRTWLDLSAYTAAQMPLREMRATLVNNGTGGTEPANRTAADNVASNPGGNSEVLLDLPKVSGEVLAGTEDTVLRIATGLLLANDSSVNVNAALHISAVGNASHGQVSLQTRVNGAGQTVTEVVFLPDPDFYGTASFSYTVSDAYGLSSTATATLLLENVNDAPYAQGEVVSGASEDATFLIDKTVLLANDGDVDDPASALGIGWVGNALNGAVSLDADGNVVFVPGLNFNGYAEFEYRTVDAAGLLSPAVPVVMPVAAVNDVPLAVDDQFQTYVNSTMTIGFAQLVGNDSDIENDTLSLVDVGNASHGVVAIVNGQVQFVPTTGFTGAASFDYLADDGNGGQTWATAFVEVKPPPNLYASVNLLGTSFYGTEGNSGRLIDIASTSWAVQDDGDTAFASVSLRSLQVWRTDYSRPESDADGPYYPYFAWQGLIGVNYFSYNSTSMHLDVKRWAGFTEFQSTWNITDDRGLVNIWHFNYSMSAGATSYMEYSGYVGPVVLSLDGSNPSYISTQYSKVSYDIELDGVSDKIAWAAPGSGVLGLDLNGDHQISNASEFAFKQYVDGAQTDLEGLKAFDTNRNGQLDAGDAQWVKFGVWEDKNADGQTQDGEYQSLDALGIATINLQSNAQVHSGESSSGGASTDVTVMGDTRFTRTDGSTGVVEDAMLAYQSGVHAQAAEADMARMALLFNQMLNTALVPEPEPLGFVPLPSSESLVAHEELLTLHAA